MSYRISSLFVLFAPTFAASQTANETRATIEYLQSLQQADGGFLGARPDKGANPSPTSSLRATTAAVRALKYFGGELPHKEKVGQFVESCFDDKTGGYSDAPKGKPDVILTAVGVMAASEMELKPEPFMTKAVAYLTSNAAEFEEIRLAAAGLEAAKQFPKEAVDRWLAEVEKLRNPDGSFGKPAKDARMTGSVVALILRVDGKMDDSARKSSHQVLMAGQRDDGGFGKADAKGSDLDTSYRVTRAFHMLNEKPKNVEKLREYIAKCRNADGGYGVEPGKPSSVGATYYASIILHWLK